MAVGVPIFKMVLIGKTNFWFRNNEDRFEEAMKMSIAANFTSKKVKVDGITTTLMLITGWADKLLGSAA